MSGRPDMRWPALVALAVALVLIGTVAGWRLAGSWMDETRVGRVSFGLSPSWGGEVEAFVPIADWGLRADAFDAPFKLRVELRSLNRGALLSAAEGDRSVLEAAEGELQDGAVEAVLVSQAWAAATVLALLVAASLLWRGMRPRWALLAVGGGLFLLASAAGAWRAGSSFDARAFQSPTYFARGHEIHRILQVAEQQRVSSGYGSELGSIVRSVSTILAEEPAPEPPGPDFYAGSDLHGNVLVVDPVARIVGESPLLLVGDFGQRAGAAEVSFLAPRVASLSPRAYAVSGNHDTSRMMEGLASEGVTVLGAAGRLTASGEFRPPPVIRAGGLSLAGFQDPLEYSGPDPSSPGRVVGLDQLPDERADALVDGWERELLRWFLGLRRKPDLLMVHQDRLGQALAEELWRRGYSRPLAIVTGDDHRQHVDRYGEVVVVDSGTLGAGGIFEAGKQNVGLGHLHFSSTGRLASVDLIAVEPFSGAARADRIVIASMCPGEDRCSFSPGSEDQTID